MKKSVLSFFIAAVLSVSLTACSNSSGGEIKPPTFMNGESSVSSSSESEASTVVSSSGTVSAPVQSSGDPSSSAFENPDGFRVEKNETAANFFIDNAKVKLNTNDAVYVRFNAEGKEYSVGAYAFGADHLQCSFGVKTDENSVSLVGEAGYFYDGDTLVLSVNAMDYDIDPFINFDLVDSYTLFKNGFYYNYSAEDVVTGSVMPLSSQEKTGRYFCGDAPLNWMHTLIVTDNGQDEHWYWFGRHSAYTSWYSDYLPGSETSLMFNDEVYGIGIDHQDDTVNVTFTFEHEPLLQYKLTYCRDTESGVSFSAPDMPPLTFQGAHSDEFPHVGDYTLEGDGSGETYIKLRHNGDGYYFGFEDKQEIPTAQQNRDLLPTVYSNGRPTKFFQWASEIYTDRYAEYARFSDDGHCQSAESGARMELELYDGDRFGLIIINVDETVAVKGEFVRVGS